MNSRTVVIPADGNCAVGRNCRDVHFEYADGTSIAYHGKYGDGTTVYPDDLTALARAAGASKVTGRSVETDYRFITGSTTYEADLSNIGYGGKSCFGYGKD